MERALPEGTQLVVIARDRRGNEYGLRSDGRILWKAKGFNWCEMRGKSKHTRVQFNEMIAEKGYAKVWEGKTNGHV